MKYIKTSDFSQLNKEAKGYGKEYERMLRYKNSNGNSNRKVKEFFLLATPENNYHLGIYFQSAQAVDDFAELCSKEIQVFLKSDKAEYIKWYDTRVDIKNIHMFDELILALDKLDPLDNEVKKELSATVVNFSAIKHLNEEKSFDEALALAGKSSDPEILWEFAQYCESFYPDDLQKAFDCYQEIPENNSHYTEANDRSLHILLQMQPSDNTEEKKELLKMKFTCSLNSREKNQEFTDQLFNELCGYGDLNPKIRGIKGEANTLLALAQQIKELVSLNKALAPKVETAPSSRLFG